MKKALLVVAASLLVSTGLWAQEHPEGSEHPQDPNKHAKTKAVDVNELEKAIKADIRAQQKKNGGVFKLEDAELNKTWELTLDHVHRERLSRLDEKTYFACVDFNAKDGTKVDVDFFLKEADGKLVRTDTTLHKVNGKPRYNWREKDGFWERVPVEPAGK